MFGKGSEFALMNIERKLAEERLMFELAYGEMSARDEGWISEEQISQTLLDQFHPSILGWSYYT